MEADQVDVVVAGHICLDIIPQLSKSQTRPEELFVPGGLVNVGPATLALGGCVANTGLALHRLGASVRLIGKVGDDLLGTTILESLRKCDEALPQSMVVANGEATSYTIVLSPPQVDRGFLHCPGANDSFVAEELDSVAIRNTRILHFGYPPLMRKVAADNGRGLAAKFAEVQGSGALVSLDMAMPPAQSANINWREWLQNVLPHVDIFLPSYDEIAPMLHLDEGRPLQSTGSLCDSQQLSSIADELLWMGVSIVVIKLGDQGLYLRTGTSVSQLRHRKKWGEFDWTPWQNRELLSPCWQVEVAGTTGAGDCTIAGFLQAMLQGAEPECAVVQATALGAYSVQSADATSNIPHWSEIERVRSKGWPQRPSAIGLDNWTRWEEKHIFVGPADGILLSSSKR